MQEAYAIASRCSKKSGERGKKNHDRKAHSNALEPGDRVLVRNAASPGGPGKLKSYWKDQVYQVLQRAGPDLPVYEVSPENGVGRTQTLHRNMLLPCDHLPMEEPAKKESNPSKSKPTRGRLASKRYHIKTRRDPCECGDSFGPSESDSDEDSDEHWTVTPGTRSPPSTGPIIPQSEDSSGDANASDDNSSVIYRVQDTPASAPDFHDTTVPPTVQRDSGTLTPDSHEDTITNLPNQAATDPEVASTELPPSDAVSEGQRRSTRERRPPSTLGYYGLGTPVWQNAMQLTPGQPMGTATTGNLQYPQGRMPPWHYQQRGAQPPIVQWPSHFPSPMHQRSWETQGQPLTPWQPPRSSWANQYQRFQTPPVRFSERGNARFM